MTLIKHAALIVGLLISACSYSAPRIANEPTLGGKTPAQTYANPLDADLVTAAIKGDQAEVVRLVKVGANVNAIATDGATPLMWASHADNLTGMEALLKSGADPNLRMVPLDGFTVMEGASGGSSPQQLELLLKHGGNPNLLPSKNVVGTSLLAVTAFQGRLDNVKLLVKAGADINFHVAPLNDGPVNAAITRGSYDIAFYLLEHGYTYRLDDIAGSVQSSLVSADREPDRQKVIQWLLAHGVKYPAYAEQQKQQ